MAWRLARSLARLTDEVEARWPGTTIWTVGDADHAARASDHNPADHDDDPATDEVVTAIDVVGRSVAKACWDDIVSARDVRVEYMIHAGLVVGADTGWNVDTYTGPNAHSDHLHVSVGRGSDGHPTRPDLFDDPSPWGIASTMEDDMLDITATAVDAIKPTVRSSGQLDRNRRYQPGGVADWQDVAHDALGTDHREHTPVDGLGGQGTIALTVAFEQAFMGPGTVNRGMVTPRHWAKAERVIHQAKQHDR